MIHFLSPACYVHLSNVNYVKRKMPEIQNKNPLKKKVDEVLSIRKEEEEKGIKNHFKLRVP